MAEDDSMNSISRHNVNLRQVEAPPYAPEPAFLPPPPPEPPTGPPPQAPAMAETTTAEWWAYTPDGATPASPDASFAPVQPGTPPSLDALTSSVMSDSTTASSEFSDSSLSSSGMITISPTSELSSSATPSFTTYPKANSVDKSHDSLKYLVPICVVAGLLVGSAFAWLGWGCLHRKPKVIRTREYRTGEGIPLGLGRGRTDGYRNRTHELEIGPAYQNDSGISVGEKDEDESEYGWKALDMRPENHGSGNSAHGYQQAELIAPSVARSPRLPSNGFSLQNAFRRVSSQKKPLSRALTAQTARTVASVYSQVDSDDYDSSIIQPDIIPESSAPTLHPDQMGQAASRRRPTHRAHASSDLGVDLLNSSIIARDPTAISELTIGHRMIEGSPLPTPAVNSPTPPSHAGFFWQDKPVDVDVYTRLPTRGRENRSKEGRKGMGERKMVPLPQSPPQITTPELETALYFSPKL